MVSKKQKEKRKDFQKQKLRVGKSKPTATTHTDTSYVAKSISLPSQSIGTRGGGDEAKEDAAGFHRYVGLLAHYSPTTRKEALVYLKSNIGGHETFVKPVINGAAPLIVDPSKSVRDTVLELLKNPEIQASMLSHCSFVMLYVHSAMTHISPDIRAQSTEFLNVMLDCVPQQVARVAWAKTLECFFPLLGWAEHSSDAALSSAAVTTGLSFGANATKYKLAHIQSLDRLLTVGLDASLDESSLNLPSVHHSDAHKFAFPYTSSPYLTLGLFAGSSDTGSVQKQVTEDVVARSELAKRYHDRLTSGLSTVVKEAGQVGRVAAGILKLLP